MTDFSFAGTRITAPRPTSTAACATGHPLWTESIERGKACLECRQRKLKCDGERPACSACVKRRRANNDNASTSRSVFASGQHGMREPPLADPGPDFSQPTGSGDLHVRGPGTRRKGQARVTQTGPDARGTHRSAGARTGSAWGAGMHSARPSRTEPGSVDRTFESCPVAGTKRSKQHDASNISSVRTGLAWRRWRPRLFATAGQRLVRQFATTNDCLSHRRTVL